MEHDSATDQGVVWRYGPVLAFVTLWAALGWLLRLDVNAYLLLGIPLTVLFQLLVRRRPLLALWVREAPSFRLGCAGMALAAALSIVPLLSIVGSVVEFKWADWAEAGSGVVSLLGAVGAAYALVNFKREHLLALAIWLIITSVLDAIQWSLFFGFGMIELEPVEGGLAVRLAILVFSFFQYVAITFVMEEVTFRMLDEHLHLGRKGYGILSATILAVLWALWHLPNSEEVSWEVIGVLLYVHVPYGICLSIAWRKTGNLLIPALAHSLGDAVRNALVYAG